MKLFGLLLISLSIQAQIYRWQDEQGRTVYSQTPPPHGQAEPINLPPAPQPDPDRLQYYRDLNRQLSEKIEQRKAERQKAQQEEKKQAQKSMRCQKAKESLHLLESTPNYQMYNPGSGRYELLDEQKRQDRYQELKSIIKQDC